MNANARLKVLRRRFRPLRPRFRLLLYILRNRRKPAGEVFRGAWEIVDKATSGTSVKGNMRNIPVRHLQHYNLRQCIKVLFPDFVPQILVDPNIIDELRAAPSVIATIHSKSELAICAALERAGMRGAIITSSPIDPINAANYGFVVRPINIARDRNVFVEARAALRDGCVVVCDVDFILDRDGPEQANYISTSFFAFQQAVKAKLYFAYTTIHSGGETECVIVPCAEEASTAEASAREFIQFIDRMQGTRSGLAIGTWRPPATEAAQ